MAATDAFEIHRDTAPRGDRTGRPKHAVDDGATTDTDASNYAEESEREDEVPEEIDESVKEDMRKLEETFTGISERYRLINRIGEGTPSWFSPVQGSVDNLSFRHFLDRVQGGRPTLRPLPE